MKTSMHSRKTVKWWAVGLALLLSFSMAGCKQTEKKQVDDNAAQAITNQIPKYIFLFIGDGMSYAQVQAAALYLGSQKSGVATQHMNFMDFPTVGCVETYDALSYIPDSASAGTAIATGHRTESSTLGLDTTGKIKYQTVAERLKAEKGYKIGIVSTVYLNHATPAAFYAHQTSRNKYYQIGVDMIQSGFDYFGGGGLNDVDNGGKSDNLYRLAENAGYKVVNTVEGANALKRGDGKTIVVPPAKDEDTITVPYRMDATDGEWQLSDYVKKGIDMLSNSGFFMMAESGKIDWACHANDANAVVSEVLALNDAVQVALDFYAQHPDDTLILITGDHETGGMSLGYADMEYTLYPQYLQRQTMSFTHFNDTYIVSYKKDEPAFASVLKNIEAVFGLIAPQNATSTSDKKLIMTDAEYKELQNAYNLTLRNKSSAAYGSYEPLTITANRVLNHHIGIGFSSYFHTAAPLPVYTKGAGSSKFSGMYPNTEICSKILGLVGLSIQ